MKLIINFLLDICVCELNFENSENKGFSFLHLSSVIKGDMALTLSNIKSSLNSPSKKVQNINSKCEARTY